MDGNIIYDFNLFCDFDHENNESQYDTNYFGQPTTNLEGNVCNFWSEIYFIWSGSKCLWKSASFI